MGAADQLPADDQAHADAGADRDEREAAGLAAVAFGLLGQGGGVDVVLHDQVRAELLAQADHDLGTLPAGWPAGQGHDVAVRIPDAGTAEDGLGDGRAVHARVGAEPVGQPDQLADPPPDAGGVQPDRAAGPDHTGQIGDRTPQVLRAQVQAEQVPGVGPDLVQLGGPAGTPGLLTRDPDQAGPFHRGQGQGHGRLGQAGQPGQVGPGTLPQPANVPQEQLLVQRPDQWGARCRHPARPPDPPAGRPVTVTSAVIIPHPSARVKTLVTIWPKALFTGVDS